MYIFLKITFNLKRKKYTLLSVGTVQVINPKKEIQEVRFASCLHFTGFGFYTVKGVNDLVFQFESLISFRYWGKGVGFGPACSIVVERIRTSSFVLLSFY